MVQQYQITLPAFSRGFHLITDHILDQIGPLQGKGLVNVFIQHTSAGICLNENADPSVRVDFESIFNQLVPENQPFYTHTMEGPDDMPAHVKSVLAGSDVNIPYADGRLLLGTWQGIYLCEFRNRAGGRRLVVTVMGE